MLTCKKEKWIDLEFLKDRLSFGAFNTIMSIQTTNKKEKIWYQSRLSDTFRGIPLFECYFEILSLNINNMHITSLINQDYKPCYCNGSEVYLIW